MSADTPDVLLEKLCQGDMAAAEEVFRTYEPYLRKVVRRQLPAWLRPKFDSVDIVQSTWAHLIEGFREAGWQFQDADHLRAFLIKVTQNRFIDRLRRYRLAGEREQALAEGGVDTLPAQDPRPSEKAQADDLWQRMLRLCPEEHRPILEMKRQGLPAAEIATRMGLHEDSIHRILRQLAKRISFPEPTVGPETAVEPCPPMD
jgi:RNA polymerase sigma-70 factor (ECF subfamily)